MQGHKGVIACKDTWEHKRVQGCERAHEHKGVREHKSTMASADMSTDNEPPGETFNYLFFFTIYYRPRTYYGTGGYVFSLFTPGWGRGTPSPSHNTSTGPTSFLGGGYPSDWSQVRTGGGGVSPHDEGSPQPGMGYPPPRIGRQMEYLIRRGRYASCVHAGGLSCFIFF